MDDQKTIDLEFMHLESLVKSQKTVTIFTCNGYQMKAVINDFDSNVIIATVNGQRQMVYRHNVSGITL